MGVLDTLKGATKARRSVTLILDPALEAEWRALSERLEEAAVSDLQGGSLARPATTEIVEQMEAIREKVATSEVTFTFEQLTWTERLALQAEHPPRKDNAIDRARGYNTDTFTEAVIRASCVSVTDATGDEATDIPADTWTALLGTLNFGQMNRLYGAATAVNESEARVPISARSLLETQDSGASLAQPGPGTSPQSGSKGGSRRSSRKSSATSRGESSDS